MPTMRQCAEQHYTIINLHPETRMETRLESSHTTDTSCHSPLVPIAVAAHAR